MCSTEAHASMKHVITAALALALAFVSRSAAADIGSVFFASKSENKNQVHYGVKLGDQCVFASDAPVYAYWRMLEKGPSVTEPLLAREQRGYGIAHQEVVGDTVRVTLRAIPNRPITIHISKNADGSCTASAETTIAGALARVYSVYIALGFLRVDHLLLNGVVSGQVVSERLKP
jgi:hypothetical protein